VKIPDTGLKKALLIVDVQPAFVQPKNQAVVDRIESLMQTIGYDAYVGSVFAAEKGSMWDEQNDWICPHDKNTHIVDSLETLLHDKTYLHLEKETHSLFKGDKDVVKFLKSHAIEEVHIVGLETNDCVLATAFSAYDEGFRTYILDECCGSTEDGLHEKALELIRYLHMSNNRCLAKTVDISF
jgi:nicotinamidase-related amidase